MTMDRVKTCPNARFADIEAEEAALTAVDRLGFQVGLRTAEGVRGSRSAFPREVCSPEGPEAFL